MTSDLLRVHYRTTSPERGETDMMEILLYWDDDDILDYRPDSDGWDTVPETDD